MTTKETQVWLENESKSGNAIAIAYLDFLKDAMPPVREFWLNQLQKTLDRNKDLGD